MEQFLLPLILLFMRVSAFVAFLPPFAGQHVPNTVKVGIALALSLFWMPSPGVLLQQYHNMMPTSHVQSAEISEASSSEDSEVTEEGSRWFLWAWLAMREIAFGAGLGWLLGLCLIPMRIAGAFLAEEMGLSFATITSPSDSTSGNILAALLEAIGVLLIFSFNIHHGFLLMFNEFLQTFQVGHPDRDINYEWIARLITRLPEHGIAMVAPVGVVMLLCLISLLFIMKQTPQFNLLAFGMPYRLLAGLGAIILLFPEVLGNMYHLLHLFVSAPEQLVLVEEPLRSGISICLTCTGFDIS